MTTPIIMVLLMIAPLLLMNIASRITHQPYNVYPPAAVGLVLLFSFTSIGHFRQTELMAQMLPAWVPQRTLIVYLTGALELAIAAGFLLPPARRLTGWVAAAMLVILLPANIYAAFNHVPMGAHASGPRYLLVRAPLQLFMFVWVYWFTIRTPPTALSAAP